MMVLAVLCIVHRCLTFRLISSNYPAILDHRMIHSLHCLDYSLMVASLELMKLMVAIAWSSVEKLSE